METNEKVTKIGDLENGTTFVFCDDDSDKVFMKGGCSSTYLLYAIDLEDGTVYTVDTYEWEWEDRPVRQIETVLTIKQSKVL